jgi:hypothetical protein
MHHDYMTRPGKHVMYWEMVAGNYDVHPLLPTTVTPDAPLAYTEPYPEISKVCNMDKGSTQTAKRLMLFLWPRGTINLPLRTGTPRLRA